MEVILKIDQRKKEAKALIEYLQNLPYVQLENKAEQKRYNAQTEKAIQDARTGKTEATNLTNFRKMLYS